MTYYATHAKKCRHDVINRFLKNEKYTGVTVGIGVVSLVYYNPDINKFCVIDYRIFSSDHDGATKLDHLLNMLNNALYSKEIPFHTVLFDTWYEIM